MFLQLLERGLFMKSKVIALSLVAAIICSAFTGCGIFKGNADNPTEDSNGRDIVFAEPTYKTFSVEEMALKLPDNYQKIDMDAGLPCFYNSSYAVFLSREAFTAHTSLKDMSLGEYGKTLLEAYDIDATLKVTDGLYCFEYEAFSTDHTTKHNYFAVLLKSNQAFWIVEFASPFWNASAMRSKFISWAKMIEFTD